MDELEKEFYLNLGKSIAGARRLRGITQGEITKAIGKSRQSIYMMESGKRAIECYELDLIAKELGLERTKFINGICPV